MPQKCRGDNPSCKRQSTSGKFAALKQTCLHRSGSGKRIPFNSPIFPFPCNFQAPEAEIVLLCRIFMTNSINIKAYYWHLAIALFCLLLGYVRSLVIPEWPAFFNIAFYAGQVTMMSASWEIMLFLNRRLEPKMPFATNPFKRVAIQLFVPPALTVPFFLALVYILYPHLQPEEQFRAFNMSHLAVLVVLSLLNLAYFVRKFFLDWQASIEEQSKLKVTAAELEKEKSMLRYHQLRNSVNPHFLFNTFTSLDGLILSNPPLASAFVRHLSKVYRYVLEQKEKVSVRIERELEFVENYMALLNIRYGKGLSVKVDVAEEARQRNIVTVTLQTLIDNAIKHNIIQDSQPLYLRIYNDDTYLIVENNIQPRKQIEGSSRQGLQQIKDLYNYLCQEPLVVENDNFVFRIKLPLL
jgi:two-component system, LytTR family, sensor kinase